MAHFKSGGEKCTGKGNGGLEGDSLVPGSPPDVLAG